MKARHAMLILTVLVASALPATAGPQTGPRFQKLDKNHDQVITRDEFPAGGDKVFKRLDKNGDAAISPAEASAARARRVRHAGQRRNRVGEKLKSLDTNGDGKIAASEWKGKPERFQQLDHDSDGFLTQQDRQKRRRN